MTGDPYVYPGTQVLRNKLHIRDNVRLERIERELVTERISQGIPSGSFDLQHLQAIHWHLFQDVYDWAGQIRTVEISKGGDQFQFLQYIQTGMRDVHRRIIAANCLRGLSQPDFAAKAGEIIGDINYVHPFREGNGRTQLQYLAQLTEHAGHRLDLTRIKPREWVKASKAAHLAQHEAMARSIAAALVDGRPKQQPSRRTDRMHRRIKYGPRA